MRHHDMSPAPGHVGHKVFAELTTNLELQSQSRQGRGMNPQTDKPCNQSVNAAAGQSDLAPDNLAPDNLAPGSAMLSQAIVGSPSSPSLSAELATQRPVPTDMLATALPVATTPSEVHGGVLQADVLNENRSLSNADMMLKMLMVAPELPKYKTAEDDFAGARVCDEYNGLITLLLTGKDSDYEPEYLIAMFRSTIEVLHSVLKSALENASVPGDTPGEETYELTIPMIDMLRTAAATSKAFRSEFSRLCRSDEAQSGNPLCIMFSKPEQEGCPSGSQEQRMKAYSTASQMFENFQIGLEVIKDWSTKDGAFLMDVITTAKQPLFCFINGFTFASVFDGRRLRHANGVASRFYHRMGIYFDPDMIFCASESIAAAFDHGMSLRCLSRILWTVSAIAAMVRRYLLVEYCIAWGAKFGIDYMGLIAKEEAYHKQCAHSSGTSTGLSNEEVELLKATIVNANRSCVTDSAWKVVESLLNRVKDVLTGPSSTEQVRIESSNANCRVVDVIKCFFESAARNKEEFGVLVAAFRCAGFRINQTYLKVQGARRIQYCEAMAKAWNDWRKERSHPKVVSLWISSEFLVSCRLSRCSQNVLLLSGSNIMSTSMIVLSGAIGSMMIGDPAGPFVFEQKLKAKIESVFYEYFPAMYNDPKVSSSMRGEMHVGKTCKDTKITRTIAFENKVRGQHEKSKLVGTRLATSLFVLSLKSNAVRDIKSGGNHLTGVKKGVVPDMVEGSKGLRQIYMIAFAMLPCARYRDCFKGTVSHLIERNRKDPFNDLTTADNVEKSWRDIQGGVMVGTMFAPLAGIAFVSSIQSLIEMHPRQLTDKQQEEMDAKRAAYINKLRQDTSLYGEDIDDRMEVYDGKNRMSFSHTTNGCVNVFASHLREEVQSAFSDAKTTLVPNKHGMVACDFPNLGAVFAQQRSIGVNFCKLISNTGVLWEDMQLLFSMQDAEQRRCNAENRAKKQRIDQTSGVFRNTEDDMDILPEYSDADDDEFEEPYCRQRQLADAPVW